MLQCRKTAQLWVCTSTGRDWRSVTPTESLSTIVTLMFWKECRMKRIGYIAAAGAALVGSSVANAQFAPPPSAYPTPPWYIGAGVDYRF